MIARRVDTKLIKMMLLGISDRIYIRDEISGNIKKNKRNYNSISGEFCWQAIGISGSSARPGVPLLRLLRFTME
jgi:hypothetical protein